MLATGIMREMAPSNGLSRKQLQNFASRSERRSLLTGPIEPMPFGRSYKYSHIHLEENQKP